MSFALDVYLPNFREGEKFRTHSVPSEGIPQPLLTWGCGCNLIFFVQAHRKHVPGQEYNYL